MHLHAELERRRLQVQSFPGGQRLQIRGVLGNGRRPRFRSGVLFIVAVRRVPFLVGMGILLAVVAELDGAVVRVTLEGDPFAAAADVPGVGQGVHVERVVRELSRDGLLGGSHPLARMRTTETEYPRPCVASVVGRPNRVHKGVGDCVCGVTINALIVDLVLGKERCDSHERCPLMGFGFCGDVLGGRWK